MSLTWILETDVFPDAHQRLIDAAERAGHEVLRWDDEWWSSESRALRERGRGLWAAWEKAEAIAAGLPAPEAAFVLDLCEHEGAISLIELNPFSGADLYDCDRDRIVSAIGALL
ncbi:MAG: hypothetical protein JKY65_31345 [Planctomycetes bacterium]|nr:hypothetical protein [Planctomycetota bacterium]